VEWVGIGVSAACLMLCAMLQGGLAQVAVHRLCFYKGTNSQQALRGCVHIEHALNPMRALNSSMDGHAWPGVKKRKCRQQQQQQTP